jgi:hypothetical protein
MLCEQLIALRWRLRRFTATAQLNNRAATLRFIRHDQRLSAALDRCVFDFVKLRRERELSQSARAPQTTAASIDTPNVPRVAMGK